MAISIIQPSSIVQRPLNSSYNILSFSPPTLPDVWACDNWYSHPEAIKLDDCLAALDMLPEGSQPDPWFLDPYRGEWWVSGTCKITLQASGPAYHKAMGLNIVPDDIRNMAGFAIDQCVRHYHTGGMNTKYLAHVTDYLTALDTVFPGPALPPSTIFLSLAVWNYISSEELHPQWNPGDYDYKVGDSIVNTVKEAAEKAPPGTALHDVLQERYEYIDRAVDVMDRTEEHPWWDEVPEADNVLSSKRLGSKESQTIKNLTESRVGSKSRSMTSHSAQLLAIERREDGKKMRRQRTKEQGKK